MTEPSERDRQIADEAVTKGPGNFRKWLYQVVADARAEGRREALLDAATALHGLPTPQVGQHPECIVLAMIEREADTSETPLRALADRPAPAAPQSGATLAIDFATAEEAGEAFAWLEQNMPSPQTGTLSMRTGAPAAPPEPSEAEVEAAAKAFWATPENKGRSEQFRAALDAAAKKRAR